MTIALFSGRPPGGASVTYATWNPADKGTNVVLSNGDLTAAVTSAALNNIVRSTIGKSTGKWYWEYTITSFVTTQPLVGVANASATLVGSGFNFCGFDANGWGYYGNNGQKYTGGVGAAYGLGYTTNDVIGVALDMTNGKVFFAKNGTWQNSGDPVAGTGAAFTGLTGTLYACGPGAGSDSQTVTANFGATAFAQTVPTGYNSGLYS